MMFEELEEFQKDIKKLHKRFRSIHDDLKIIRKLLKLNPSERPPFSYRISGLGIDTPIIKVKKIACKSLKGKGAQSGLRLIYAVLESDNMKETRIVLIELFHKSDKELEDRQRILSNFK